MHLERRSKTPKALAKGQGRRPEREAALLGSMFALVRGFCAQNERTKWLLEQKPQPNSLNCWSQQ